MEPRDKVLAALCLLVALMALQSCTDAARAKMGALGNDAYLDCFSGGVKVYEGETTGKILETNNSDGFTFVDKKTGGLVQTNAECVIRYKL
jgi:hypothetical protein